ncbi:MAG: hypothetical protein ACTSRG_17445 [Candidatus Helarchaeota archaeon]
MKKKLIIISEIKGISLPYPISIKISKKEVFIYQTDYTQRLEKMKDLIQKIGTEKNVVDNISINHIMKKEREKSIYLISDLKINFYEKKEDLIRKIYEFFNPIRIIFSFILGEIFKINKIIIMKKQGENTFEVKRYIKISTETDINENRLPIVFYNHYLDIEKHLSEWGRNIDDKREYIDFFNIFLHGKYLTQVIEIKISFYWNSLENLALIFCNNKGWTKVLKKGSCSKYNKMNTLIKPIRKEIIEKDFDFPNFTVEEFKKFQLCTINNNLTANIRIDLLCQEIGIDYNQDAKNLIDLMNFIRNRLYHRGMPFFKLANEIIKRRKRFGFKSFDFQDLISKVSEFELLVQKIFLTFLNLIPKHLTNFDNTNRFIWKSHTSELESESEMENSDLLYYNNIYERIIRKEKYIPLLKKLEKEINPLVNQIFKKDNIEGFLYRNEKCYQIQVRFDNEFKGKFESSKLHIKNLESNKFLFKAKTENGLKLLFNFHIDLVEPKEPIGGIMKLEEFLKKFYRNKGYFSTLYLEIGF